LVGIVNVDMTAENEFIRFGVPSLVLRLGPVVVKGVFNLASGLVNLGAGQMALDAPFDRFGAARGDPDRRMGLLYRARPDRAVVQFKNLPSWLPTGLVQAS
jgi:hypothetical protein